MRSLRPMQTFLKNSEKNEEKGSETLDSKKTPVDNRRKGSELFETTGELISHMRRRSSLEQGTKPFSTLGSDIQSFAKHTKQPEGLDEKKKNHTGEPGEQGEGPVANDCGKRTRRNNECMQNGCGEPSAITLLKSLREFRGRNKVDTR